MDATSSVSGVFSKDDGGGGHEVTAIGSLARYGSTFFVFAVRQTIYTVRESSNFTVATATSWTVPEIYGEIHALQQVSPQVMACGTSSGALLFYHVLGSNQAGAALWVVDTSLDVLAAPTIPIGFPTVSRPRRFSTSMTTATAPLYGGNSRYTNSSSMDQRRSEMVFHITSRITKLHILDKLSPRLLLSAHADGTVALWHSLRRVFLGSVNLTAAGVDEGNDDSTILIAVDSSNTWLAFADEGGNVHVCTFHVRPLQTEEEEAAARSFANPAMYFPSIEASTVFPGIPGKSQSREGEQPQNPQKQGTYLEEDRMTYAFDSFRRVRVFGTGFPTLTSIIILTPPALPPPTKDEDESGANARAADPPYNGPIVVVSSVDNYTRAFTADGTPMGEFGMSQWDVQDPASYRLMGEANRYHSLPHSVPKAVRSDQNESSLELQTSAWRCRWSGGSGCPPQLDAEGGETTADTALRWDKADGEYDYLMELHEAHAHTVGHVQSMSTTVRRRGKGVGSPTMSQLPALSRAVRIGADNIANRLAAADACSTPVPQVPVPLKDVMRGVAGATALAGDVAKGRPGQQHPSERLTTPMTAGKHVLRTIMRPSNHVKLVDQRYSRGILRGSCVNALRKQQVPLKGQVLIPEDSITDLGALSHPSQSLGTPPRHYTAQQMASNEKRFAMAVVRPDFFTASPSHHLDGDLARKGSVVLGGDAAPLVRPPTCIFSEASSLRQFDLSTRTITPMPAAPAVPTSRPPTGMSTNSTANGVEVSWQQSWGKWDEEIGVKQVSCLGQQTAKPVVEVMSDTIPQARHSICRGTNVPFSRYQFGTGGERPPLSAASCARTLDRARPLSRRAMSSLRPPSIAEGRQPLDPKATASWTPSGLSTTSTPFGPNAKLFFKLSEAHQPEAPSATDDNPSPVKLPTGVTPMSVIAAEIAQKIKQRRSAGSRSGTVPTDAHSFLAQVSARMLVSPVAETEPPVGSRSRQEAMEWRDHINKLQSGPDNRRRR